MIDHFVKEETCHEAQRIYDALKCFSKNTDVNGNAILHPVTILQYKHEVDFMFSIARKTLNIIKRIYDVDKLFIESVFIARLLKDDYLPTHADNANYNRTIHRWIANHVPWRDYSGIIYMSNVEEGGELSFEYLDMNVKPCLGRLVVFPSSKEWSHGVLSVKQGVRYSCPVWFTKDPVYDMKKRIPC